MESLLLHKEIHEHFFSRLHSFTLENGHLESFFFSGFPESWEITVVYDYCSYYLDEVCYIVAFDSPGLSRNGCKRLVLRSSVWFGLRKHWFGSQIHSMGCSQVEAELERWRAEVDQSDGERRTVERLRNGFGAAMRFLPQGKKYNAVLNLSISD